MTHRKLQPFIVALLLFAGMTLANARARRQQPESSQASQPDQPAATAPATQGVPAPATQNAPAPSAKLNAANESSAERNTPPIADTDTIGIIHTLPTGSIIQVRIADTINSSKDHAGDLITGTIDPSVFVDNHVVIPRGTEVHMRLMKDKKGHPLGGKAEIRLELTALVLNKEKLDVDGSDFSKHESALSAKIKSAGIAGAGSSTGAATSATPETAAASPIVAAFSSAKVIIPGGTRVTFVLHGPFTFAEPANDGTGS